MTDIFIGFGLFIGILCLCVISAISLDVVRQGVVSNPDRYPPPAAAYTTPPYRRPPKYDSQYSAFEPVDRVYPVCCCDNCTKAQGPCLFDE